ncbi:MAG TPA: CpaD family pilus assembly lipoprotein [Alphaproteobacteria bacterium]|jgi:pilus assembly protein CpaD
MTSLRVVAIVLCALSAAACTPTEAYWSEAQSPKQNQVEAVRLTHDMRPPVSGKLGGAELASLDDFLTRHDVGYGDAVTVLAGSERAGKPLSDYLRRQGIQTSLAIPAAGAADLPAGGVRLLVERYVVVPPNCPDWSKPSVTDYGNTPMSNLGCANAANLGMMLANPRDLIQGQRPGDADGTVAAASVQRYRADKVKSLDKGATTE